MKQFTFAFVMTLQASEREAAPESPTWLRFKSKEVKQVLTVRALEREAAPETPIRLSHKDK